MPEQVTAERVKDKMASLLRQPVTKLQDDKLLTDLVTQSLLLVEMVIELQDAFNVRLIQDDLKVVRSVGDLTQLIASRVNP